jgi:carboxypeptidase D
VLWLQARANTNTKTALELVGADPQESDYLDAQLAQCQVEMDKFTDPFNTPTNINNCGGVMDAVSQPFVKE